MNTTTMLLKATCCMCRLPIPCAPDPKAMCRPCGNGLAKMRQVKPGWVDEVVRRMVAR